MRTAILGLAAVLAATPAFSAAQTVVPAVSAEGTRLDIVATGESNRVPDLATIGAGIVTEASTAAAALADNNRQMRAVLRALAAAGVEDRDIRTAQIGLNPRYDYSDRSTPRLIGYTATNRLTVRFREIARAGAIIDVLVGEGINQISGPNLTVDEPEAALDEARRDAMRAARARAELYAAAAGMRVARIVAISEAGAARPPVVMQRGSMAMNEAADNMPIAPGEQRLTATISVTFELE